MAEDAFIKNLTISCGATFNEPLVYIKDGDDFDFNNNYFGKMQVRTKVGGELITTLSTENDGITLGMTDGTVTLYISANITKNFQSFRFGVYDIFLKNATNSDQVIKLVKGKVEIIQSVTTDADS